MEDVYEKIKSIRNQFLKLKLKDLETGARFKNGIPQRFEEYTVLDFLEKFDPNKHKLIGCATKELDLFRLYLEANAVDWYEYKIKNLFKNNRFVKGAFFDKNRLKSEEFNSLYNVLHTKRKSVESIQLNFGF